ncbi:MAG: hypothetical protein Q9169_001191 [Polycauliona sp. 2 TL-2023]
MLRHENHDLTKRVLLALVIALCTVISYLWRDSTLDFVIEQYRPPTNRKDHDALEESFDDKILADDIFLSGSDAPGLALDRAVGAYVQCLLVTLPTPMFGTYEETGLGSGYCFTRRARNRAYGDEDLPSNGPHPVPPPEPVDWERVNWGRLQQQCYARNRDRFQDKIESTTPMFRFPNDEGFQRADDTPVLSKSEHAKSNTAGSKKYKKRNAVLLRTHDTKTYTPDTVNHIRSMINELSLHSGAEYEVFLMVQISDLGRSMFDNGHAYQEMLDDYVPREFHEMTILFNAPLLEAWYPKAAEHDPKNSQQAHMTQSQQLFSLLRPDFDLYWQIELDVRYTGHHYRHLEAVRQFAEEQPRKLQWERASYFYSPSVHRTWNKFCDLIQKMTKDGGIWGADRTQGITAIGPDPPTLSAQQDDYDWGVGESADLINIMPMVDPTKRGMVLGNWIQNCPNERCSTPFAALSKRLLHAMHHSQVAIAQTMPEMFPASTALQHGMKAVVFPEPIYLDLGDRSPEELEAIFNRQGQHDMWNDASSMSTLAHQVNHWWSTISNPKFSNELYRRWLGIDSDGNEMGDNDPELCLPAVILHPVSDT